MLVRRVDGEAVAEVLGEEILQERHNDLGVSILLIYLLFHVYIYIYIYIYIILYIFIIIFII
jgi:hypothetical protein